MGPRELQVDRARTQAPADLPEKRQPIRLANVHAVPRARPVSVRTVRNAPVRKPPGRVARFHAWRRAHYVADQALRVVAILVGGALTFAIAVRLLIWALVAILGPILATLASLLGAAAVVVLILFIASALSGSGDGHKDGWGFHWSRCK